MIAPSTKRLAWLAAFCLFITACKKDREVPPALVEPPAPTITGLSPATGQTGSSFSINGTHFGSATTEVSVAFMAGSGTATQSTVGSVTDTKIEAMVPADIAPGAYTVKVTASGKTVTAKETFTVTAPVVAPDSLRVTGFSPTTGTAGSTVTITGTKFSSVAADNTVTFTQGTQETVATVTDAWVTSLSVTVPNSLMPGNYTIKVKSGGKTVAASDTYAVQAVSPSLTNFAPTSGETNTVLTITGTGFAADAAQNSVYFVQDGSARMASVSSATATSLTVTVPYVNPGAYKIEVTVNGKKGTSTEFFTVTAPVAPSITSFSPLSGQVTTNVVITGSNFAPDASANQVSFEKAGSSVIATVKEATSTSLSVTVPSGLTAGEYAIKVQKNGLSATAAGTFRVLGPGPSIHSFSPLTGDVGDRLTIMGSNFSTVASENTVTFVKGMISVPVVVTQAVSHELEVAVPSTLPAGDYQIQVNTKGQISKTSSTFKASITDTEPFITSISPNPVGRGQVLTLTGSNLKTAGRVTDLHFYPIGGGVTQTHSVAVNADGTQITFTIPSSFSLKDYIISISKREPSVIGEAPAAYYGTAPGKLTVQ